MKRRLPLIFVAVVIVLCLVAASVAAVASGVSGSAVAYQVNDTKVSQATVDQDLKALADTHYQSKIKQVFSGAAVTTDGAVSSSFTATWLTLQIRNELFRQALEKANVSVSSAEKEKQRAAIDGLIAQNGLTFKIADLPAPLEDTLLKSYAYPVALGLTSDAKLTAFFRAALRNADIRVDPRYGRWNPARGAVCAPTGCASSASTGGG
jgi:hypothetical protein